MPSTKDRTKYVVVIPDGMGDRPLARLSGKTPLEAAFTPNLDFFSSRGTVGLSRNIPDGFTPGTDIGCMSLLGYDPAKFFTGRGPLEAAELGIELKPKEVAFRCNLVTLDGAELKDFSADHISTAEARTLLNDLNDSLPASLRKQVRFYPGRGTGYRNLMICGQKFAGLKCTPPHDIMGRRYAPYLPKGKSAEFLTDLMKRSQKVFADHRVNQKRAKEGKGAASVIWPWGQGHPPVLPSYYQRFGLKGAVITAVDLVKGIAIHAGLDVVRVPGVTGYFDTNYVGKAEYAINALRSRDFVVIHVESTDEAGHMGDPQLKIRAIEDVDRLVLGTLRARLTEFESYKVLVLPDHYTCIETRTHASDPVPFVIYSSTEERRGPSKFCERTATESGVVVEKGHQLIERFVRGFETAKRANGAAA